MATDTAPTRSTATRPERLRVAYLINSLRVGGAERLLWDIASRVDAARFDQRVLCLYEGGALRERFESAGIPVEVVGAARHVGPQNWLRVWRALGTTRPDVLHAHLPESTWYGLPAARARGIPVRIAHLHNCRPGWSERVRRLDRAMSGSATHTVACSQAVGRFALDELGYRPEQLEVLLNGIDLDRFRDLPPRAEARRRLGLPAGRRLLVCVAALEEQKGHGDLIMAMRGIHAADPRTLLLLAGGGTPDARGRLEALVAEFGLGDAVRFLGPRDDVPLLLAAGDAFVLASRWEGLPLALAEAGAAGLPVVATAVDGSAEVVEDRVTGLLVPPRSPRGLADAVLRLLGDPALAARLGADARERVRAEFDVGRLVERLEAFYEAPYKLRLLPAPAPA